MLDSFVIGLREGLESALIIGIILIYLVKSKRQDLKKSVFLGTGAGVSASIVIGISLFAFASEAGEEMAEYFEVVMMIAAAGLITYFLFWLHKNRNVAAEVQKQVDQNTSQTGLFILAFLSVTREGMELVIFNMTQVTEGAFTVMLSSLLGIVAAIVLAFIIFKTSVNLNLKLLFAVLGAVLVYIGGHLFGEGLVELGEITGWIEGEEIEEAVEISAMLIYIIPSLIFLFFKDIKKLNNRTAA